MTNRFIHKIILAALVLMSVSLCVQADELCMDGTLLFREDFGGNDPNDPKISTTAVPGMSYTQATTDVLGSMGGGKYLVTKQGYCNGNGTSQWHLQDDHTHFGDLTRGYLLEIDGRGDNAAFYSTTIDGLCEGSHLTFSAYVANVMTWGMYIGRPGMYAYPGLKFVLADPVTDAELATYDTGDIPFDSAFIGDNMCWQQSVEWRLVGMNFTVPAGQNSVKLTIYNNATGSNGNDFAIDDIEVRLCAPPVTIDGETEVCENKAIRLTANFTNYGTFAEPLGYKWWHYVENEGWISIGDYSSTLPLTNIQKNDSGLYRVAVSSLQDIETLNCRAMSEPFMLKVKECIDELCVDGTLLFRENFGGNDPSDPDISMESVPGMDPSYHNYGNSLGNGNYTLRKEGWHNGIQWHWQDDHTYFGDKTRGYLLEVDGMGGAKPFYSKTIDGLCAGSKLTFSAYVVNVHYAGQLDYFGSSYVYPRLKFVLKDPETDAVLAEQSTGDIQPDWRYGTSDTWKYARDNQLSAEWQLIGMNFTVPDGIGSIQMYIYNDVEQNGNGNDFALDDIEIHLCAPPVTIDGEAEVCENTATTLAVNFTNDGTFAEPLAYKWWFSADSSNWTELSEMTNILSFSAIQQIDSGWYQVAVAGVDNIGSVNCRAMSEPFLLTVKDCTPPVEQLCTEGILLFREDFGGNDPNDPRVSQTPVPGMTYTQATTDVWNPSNLSVKAGKYIVTKSGYCNGDTASTNAPNNRRSQWFIQDDHTYPNDYTRGYFMEVDGKGDNAVFYTTTIDGLCEGIELSFLAYVANLQLPWYYENQTRVYPRLQFTLLNPTNNVVLGNYDTGDIPYDSTYLGLFDYNNSSVWRRVGMNFTVPEGVNSITLKIANNTTGNNGNDFALDDIEVRLCMTPDTVRKDTTVCDTISQILWREKSFALADTLRDTLRTPCGFDSIYYIMKVGTEICCPDLLTITADTVVCDTLMPYRWRDTLFTEPAKYEILYKNQRGCDSLLLILTLNNKICCPDLHYTTRDTIVCDTLMPYTWHGLLFDVPGSQTTIEQDERGCDTLQTTWTLNTKICCPDLITITADTTVCDTLMPYRWRDTLFTEPAKYEILYKNQRGCDSLLYVLTLSTTYCERPEPPTPPDPPTPPEPECYPIIVNKYNLVLLVDNVKVSELFPNRTVQTFQWYKNGEPISGANEDDYSEQDELHGEFQIILTLNGGEEVCSNILAINVEQQAQQPIQVRIFNSHGMPVSENQITRGIYLYRYEQGEIVWTEKRLIP